VKIKNKDAGEVNRNKLVYAPVEGNSYKLHYEIELDDGTAYLVDSVTTEVKQILE
jgi:hypothetical protein